METYLPVRISMHSLLLLLLYYDVYENLKNWKTDKEPSNGIIVKHFRERRLIEDSHLLQIEKNTELLPNAEHCSLPEI